MTRIRRRRIALFMSLLMTAFLFCQGMAQAAIVGAVPARQQAPMSMSCHDSSAKSMLKAQPECPSNCQHLDNASDSSSHLLAALDCITPMVAFLLPAVAVNVGAIQLASLSSVPPDPDPPAEIRFHRFRE